MTDRKILIYDCIGTFLLGISLMLVLIVFSFSDFFTRIFKNPLNSAILEEVLKYCLVLFLVMRFKLRLWAIPLFGVGFGLSENFLRLIMWGYAIFFPYLLHIILASIMALFIYLARKPEAHFKTLYYGLALVIPVLLHVSYNLFITNLARG